MKRLYVVAVILVTGAFKLIPSAFRDDDIGDLALWTIAFWAVALLSWALDLRSERQKGSGSMFLKMLTIIAVVPALVMTGLVGLAPSPGYGT